MLHTRTTIKNTLQYTLDAPLMALFITHTHAAHFINHHQSPPTITPPSKKQPQALTESVGVPGAQQSTAASAGPTISIECLAGTALVGVFSAVLASSERLIDVLLDSVIWEFSPELHGLLQLDCVLLVADCASCNGCE